MNTLIIDDVEHKINDEVANLVLLISKERDELKQTLTEKPDAGATLACSDGLSCPLLDECDAVSEAIGDKQVLASALREIYNIRGEDKDIDRIVNAALQEACAT